MIMLLQKVCFRATSAELLARLYPFCYLKKERRASKLID